MPHLMGIFRVSDFTKWKAGFDTDQGKAMRKDMGMRSYALFHVENDPNRIVILCEFDDLTTARKFEESPELKEASRQAGVTEEAGPYYLKDIEERTV